MPHITVPTGLPGIAGPLTAYPETGELLRALAEALLRASTPTLSSAERELIAAHVSNRNQCRFCTNSHAAAARHLWGAESNVVDEVLSDPGTAPLDERMKALLTIAGKVQQDGKEVRAEDIERARTVGADDRAIHDTVLIAAAFCMFNRYVDGLATEEPPEPSAYMAMGAMLAEEGYIRNRRS